MAFGPGWANQGDMMSAIAQSRARRERGERELDADVQGGQRVGRAIGGLVGTVAPLIPGPQQPALMAAAPVLPAALGEVGGQVGRVSAGGDLGYDNSLSGATAAVNVTNAGIQAAQEDAYLAKMEEITGAPELWMAYEAMPVPLQQRMRQRPEVFDQWYEGGMWR
tara:strand:+ start:162 stop:656 length:495 start_codon:yes stop_codon:yes gene_type:complete